MKLFALISVIFVTLSFSNRLPAPDDVAESIASAIRSGNAKELTRYFNTNVDLTILDNEGMYAKPQAEVVLQDFFNKNKPTEFSIKHKSAKPDGAQYYIGTMRTSAGKEYQIYFLLKNGAGGLLVQSFNIEAH